MRIVDVKKQEIHGGTIRVYVTHKNNQYKVHSRVKKMFDQEKSKELNTKKIYSKFASTVEANRKIFTKLITKIKNERKKIVGYGAAAKGNVFLNYYKLGDEDIPYIVDSIEFKQGKFTPGTHIPIFPEDKLQKEKIDYLIILAWNFSDEIMKKQKKFHEKGGKFIICTPKPIII